MSGKPLSAEIGLELTLENSESGIQLVLGTGVPDGTSGEQQNAGLGSLYFRTGTSEIYKKIANAGAPADYELLNTSASVGTFRGEKVRAVTNDTVTAGVARDLVASPFADDDGTTLAAADFTVGQFIIADADGTPVLLEVTNVSAPNVTFSTPSSAPALADQDTFTTRYYLPDSGDSQEGQAIVQYNGSVMVKIGDIDWNFADGINLAAGYTAGSGDITASDTVQTAIQKLDGNNDAQDSVLGTTQGATNLGTFSGSTISDNGSVKAGMQELELAHEEVDQNVNDLITLSGMPENSTDLGTFIGGIISDNTTVKNALQELESKDEAQDLITTEIDGNVDDLITLSGVAENSTNLGAFVSPADLILGATETVKSALQKIGDFLGNLRSVEVTSVTTITDVDTVPVASVYACKWLVTSFEEATPTNRKAVEIYALNDGTNADKTVYAKLKRGSAFDINYTVDVSGGNMRLRASSSTAGVTVRARRIAVEDV